MTPRTRLLACLLASALLARAAAPQTPVEYEIAALLPSSVHSGAFAGHGVAVSGDDAFVGAPFEDVGVNDTQGVVAIFRWNGSAWVESQPQITESIGRPDDLFGEAIALSGDVAAIGAVGADTVVSGDAGAVWVQRRTAGSWTEEQELYAADGGVGDFLGEAVAVDGDVVLAGAPGDDIGVKSGQGSAYVFRWNGTSWTQEQKLLASDGLGSDDFGSSVALRGDLAFVGAPGDKTGAEPETGSVYVFRWNGSAWVQEQKLLASDPADLFGAALAVDGDTLVAGAPFDAVPGYLFHGSAIVFREVGAAWVEEQQLFGSDLIGNDTLGSAVAVSGDVIVLGAHHDVVGGNPDQGSAWVFRRTGDRWFEEQHLLVAAGEATDELGMSVGVSGNLAIVGAYRDKVPGVGEPGSAYAFDLLGSAWTWLGQSLAGTNGHPALGGFGDLSPGSSVTFALGQARPNAPVFVVLGLNSLSAPFKGGVLVPAPDVVLGGFATDADGVLSLTSTWPGGIPSGTTLWGQEWIPDPAGPFGFAASNALAGMAP